MTNITIQSEGRRHYLVGDTYPIRSAIRNAGCKWDSDRRAWWTGKLETAQKLVGKVASGAVVAECAWRKVGADFLVAVPAGMTAKAGDTVTVRASSGSTKTVQLASEVQPGLFAVAREPRKAPERLPKFVGVEGAYKAEFAASKRDRSPGREVGSSSWLRHGGQRIAVVLVGYEPAGYVSSEAAEDMGHYNMESGYYGLAHYRAATQAEFAELQAKSPREDGVCVEQQAAPDRAAAPSNSRCPNPRDCGDPTCDGSCGY